MPQNTDRPRQGVKNRSLGAEVHQLYYQPRWSMTLWIILCHYLCIYKYRDDWWMAQEQRLQRRSRKITRIKSCTVTLIHSPWLTCTYPTSGTTMWCGWGCDNPDGDTILGVISDAYNLLISVAEVSSTISMYRTHYSTHHTSQQHLKE